MSTSPSAEDSVEDIAVSPFSGCQVHTLIGIDFEHGAPQPWFDDECWPLTGVRGLPVQVRPHRVTWNFAVIANPVWRMIAREFLIAMLAPRHERVFELPSARREPIAVVTGSNRLQATVGWFRWLTKEGVGSLHDVTQEHCDRYLIHRLESGTSQQRIMAEVVVLKDLARYGELITTDRYLRGFEPWSGKSAAAVTGVSSSAIGNTTPVVPEHILRPALHAALYLVDCIGPRLVDLLDRLRARQDEPTVHGWPSPAELATAMADRIASRNPLPEADARVVRERLADGWEPGPAAAAQRVRVLP